MQKQKDNFILHLTKIYFVLHFTKIHNFNYISIKSHLTIEAHI